MRSEGRQGVGRAALVGVLADVGVGELVDVEVPDSTAILGVPGCSR
ncbi:MAG TPA: hypothetical protein VFV02_17240 [Acidimicrobiales bacterium]|nr:hypothetical protein [Acidimicrobiales bacterium]